MANTKVKAVLFDLGDTVLNFGKLKTAELFRRGAERSYEFLKSAGQPVCGLKQYCYRNLISIRLHYFLSSVTKRDFDSLELLRKIGTKAGYKLDENQWLNLAWLWYQPLSERATVEPDIVETLSALKALGLKLAILSNTFINAGSLEKHLQKFDILRFFPVRLYSYQFPFRKPDARIFQAAAEKIAEPLKNVMFVGDRIDNDARPAIKAGMQATLKKAHTNIGREIPQGIWKIDKLCELPDLIRSINAKSDSPEPSDETAAVNTYTRSV